MEESKLPPKLERLVEDFVARVKAIYGEGLVSITLYGSAASSEFSGAHSNLNLAVVLLDTSLSNLAKIAPVIKNGKFRILNVLFFTEHYIADSADVFPIEFLDIKENHKVLYGKDIFSGLAIDTKNLRFQCEQELKSKIINIKKAYLQDIGNPELDKALVKFFTSSLHILRNILRLKTGRVLYRKEDILNAIAGEFKVDVSGMSRILEARNANKRLPKKDTVELFNSFVGSLENIADAVDGL